MTNYRIYERNGYFRVSENNERVGKFFDNVEDAKLFIEELKKMKDFNISQVKEGR